MKRLLCRLGVHDWSEWAPVAPLDPAEGQWRRCSDCDKLQNRRTPGW